MRSLELGRDLTASPRKNVAGEAGRLPLRLHVARVGLKLPVSLTEQPLAADAPVAATPRLPPITADRAITLARRWIIGSWLFNALMITVVVGATFVGFARGIGAGPGLLAGLVWLVVLMASIRARRLAFEAIPMIVAGEFGQAEEHLGQSLRTFSLLKSAKLLGLHQLAMLRHAQAKWGDAAKLCRELLARGKNAGNDFNVQNRLMLAESLVELGDTGGAGVELLGLSSMRLDLRETLVLTQIRLDLQAHLGHWHAMMAGVQANVGMVELMPTALAARSYALLALAAKRVGDEAWHALLARRATLLVDADLLVKQRPFLRDAFA